jgi:hypothetical protein
MTKNKQVKPSIVVEVFNAAESAFVRDIAVNAVNVSKSNDELITMSADFLGATPTLERWNGFFTTLIKHASDVRGVAIGTAENIAVSIRKELKARYELDKPKSAKAEQMAEMRAIREKELNDKYGSKSIKDLKDMIIATNDGKQLKELSTAIATRNKANESEQKAVDKDFIKEGLAKINAWIKTDNTTDLQVERVTAVLNFINSKN